MTDLERLIKDEANKSWRQQDFTTKLTEQGMQTASVMYPIGFREGAKWALELKDKKYDDTIEILGEERSQLNIAILALEDIQSTGRSPVWNKYCCDIADEALKKIQS